MNMNQDSQHIDDHHSQLISKYLSGNASATEVEELEAWVLADPVHKAQFMTSKKAWMLTGMEQGSAEIEIDELWTQTSGQLWGETKVVELKPKHGFRKWWGVAAAAIVLLIVASVLLFQNLNKPTVFIAQTTNEIQEIELSDGSQITLNQSSSLEFMDAGESRQRKIELEGDAFFDVARDEKHPFIIQTQSIEIEVLGTSFYVDSRKNESEIQVVVESGQVVVRSGTSETILSANEKAVFQKNTQQLIKEQNDDVNSFSLKTKKLVFEDTRLEAVVSTLNRQFHADISIENETLKNCPLTATYEQNSLKSILTIMEASFGIQVREEGQKMILYGVCSVESAAE